MISSRGRRPVVFARGLVFGCLAAAGALDATSVPVDGGAVALEWEPFDATQLPTACDFARIDAGEPDLFARVVNATGPLIIDGLVASSWRGFGDTLASRREFLRHESFWDVYMAAYAPTDPVLWDAWCFRGRAENCCSPRPAAVVATYPKVALGKRTSFRHGLAILINFCPTLIHL